jgi:hypothetical protein
MERRSFLGSALALGTLGGVAPGCGAARPRMGEDRRRMARAPLSPLVLSALVAALAGCPGTSSPRDGGGDLDAWVPPGTDAPIPPGTDAPAADAPAPPALTFCRLACSSASDCVTPSAAFDADNYACTGGGCVYEGCNTDDECRSSFVDARYVCRDVGTGTPICTLGCAATSDCVTASAAFDADNYTCTMGACRYQGCNTDDECRSTYADARYVCRMVDAVPILPLPTGARNCVLGCTTSADCTTPSAAFDADNYECRGGACIYVGCRSPDECRTSFADGRYTCL